MRPSYTHPVYGARNKTPRGQFLLLFILLMGPRAFAQERSVDGLLMEARKTFAPDRRTSVFDVTPMIRGKDLILKGEVQSVDMKRALIEYVSGKTDYKIIDSVIALPHPMLGEKTYGMVSVSVANMRAKPSHAAELVTQVLLGTPLRLLKKEDGWYYVQTPEDYLGWTDDPMAIWDKQEYEKWKSAPRLIVTTEYGFVRQSRERTSPVVSDIVVGCILKLRSETAAHYEVEYPDGRVGFLDKESAQPLTKWLSGVRETPEVVLSTAHRFMGVPYLWGGTSAKGFDCSGYTKTVYFLNGVLLPRDADQQARVGEAVDTSDELENLKPGDLMFFGTRAEGDRPERITHVGIYLGGKKFIHCSGDVHINSFNPQDPDFSPRRRSGFLKSTRILGAGKSTGVRRLSQDPYYSSHEPQ